MLKNTSYDGSTSDEATVISKGVKIEGKLSCSGSIRLDGEVKGDISSQSAVIIGENGKVNGQINAENITIGGQVTGTVKAKEKLIYWFQTLLFVSFIVSAAGLYFHIEEEENEINLAEEEREHEENEGEKPLLAPLSFAGLAVVKLLGTMRKWKAEVR